MPTRLMKLGFEDRVLSQEHFRNIVLNEKQVGCSIGVYLNYYRGLPVSCIEKLELTIDGEIVPEQLICVAIRDKKFSVSQLKYLFSEFWGTRTRIDLEVYNGGLAHGRHDVGLTLELRSPYMRFAPRIYGALDSSSTKTMTLNEEPVTL